MIILNYNEHVIIRDDGGNSRGGFGGFGGFRGCSSDRGGGLAVVAVSIIVIIMALSVMITAATNKPQCGIRIVLLFQIILVLVNLKGL